jgi:hypothetical protein
VSSYDGTKLTGEETDPGLQIAPPDDQGPEFSALKNGFEQCLNSVQTYIDQCRLNRETRYAVWPGQSSDGKKHTRGENNAEPIPWDGASDLRVYLADEAINSKVAMQCAAFRKANIVASPVEGNDYARAKTVASFMRWLIQTQIPEIDREVELLSNYIQEKGAAVAGVFWEKCQEKTLAVVSIESLQAQFPQVQFAEIVMDPTAEDGIHALFEEIYACSNKKAKKMLRELRRGGTTTVPVVGREISRPIIRAFSLDNDVFVPGYSTDIEAAPGIWRLQYFTPEQLRGFVHTDGWDESWVEAAIDKCRGKRITPDAYNQGQYVSRSFVYDEQDLFTNLVGVVYAYQRQSDEDGIPGCYLTIFNPMLPDEPGVHDGYAKHTLLAYTRGEYPFVLFRREMLSRTLHDSRGLPEPAKPYQDQIKAHRDARIDAASYAILPPMMYPVGRPPGRWGAGARVPERRPGEYHFADRPAPDMNTEKSEQLLLESFYRYNGFTSRDTDPTFANLKNQQEVDKFLAGCGKIFRKVFKLYQQYGSDEIYFRVIGLKSEEAVKFAKGDAEEDFDFYLNFSVDTLDPETTFAKLEQIAKIVATADRDGVVNYAEWLQVMIEAVDPTIAERIIEPKNIGTQRVVGEMQDLLAKVYAGQDQDIKLGTPPQLGMQVIQGYVQGDPMVQRRMANKEDPFGQRIEKLVKQLQFQATQQENAKIGRYGA